MSQDLATKDPIGSLMDGRAILQHDFELRYGYDDQGRTRVRVFRNGPAYLVAFAWGDKDICHYDMDDLHISRYVDLLAPVIIDRFKLDPNAVTWLEHDSNRGCLSLIDMEWRSPGCCTPKWQTFQHGEYHLYAGKDYVVDLLRVLDQRGLGPSTQSNTKALEEGSTIIDVEVVNATQHSIEDHKTRKEIPGARHDG